MTPRKETESDHDLLIRLDEQVGVLCKQMTNHLAHHWAVELALAVTLMGAVIGLIFK